MSPATAQRRTSSLVSFFTCKKPKPNPSSDKSPTYSMARFYCHIGTPATRSRHTITCTLNVHTETIIFKKRKEKNSRQNINYLLLSKKNNRLPFSTKSGCCTHTQSRLTCGTGSGAMIIGVSPKTGGVARQKRSACLLYYVRRVFASMPPFLLANKKKAQQNTDNNNNNQRKKKTCSNCCHAVEICFFKIGCRCWR